MQHIDSSDPRLSWSGAVAVERGDGWVQPWRVPHADLDLYAPGDNGLAERAAAPAGVRLRFATDAEWVGFGFEPMAEPVNMDLYADGELVATADCAAGATEQIFDGISAGRRVVELWPFQSSPFRLRRVILPDGAVLERCQDLRPRWLTYGSSITQCRTAASPSFTWPAVVARGRGFNLTALGFGGQCHADPMIARLMRDLPAELLTIKLGINIYGGGTLGMRTFRPAVLGTIATIRDGHPHTPFVVCSPIFCPSRETEPSRAGLTLQQMRAEVEAAVDSFRRRGDDRLYYVDGLKLLDEELAGHLPDGLHPDAEGYRRMGENFLHEVFTVQGVQVAAR